MKKSTTVTSESSYGVTDWRTSFLPERANPPERSSEIKDFFQALWPAAATYDSALNPVFLIDLPSLSKFSGDECWLVRDGLIPLLWFFTQNPSPDRFKGRLRIHADLEVYVPEAWRPQVELYELFADSDPVTQTRTEIEPGSEILLTGLVRPSVCSIAQLERDLREITRAIGGRERLSYMKFFAYLPIRHEDVDHRDNASFPQVFFQTLFREAGLDVVFFEYEGFQWMHTSPKIWFHELNQKLLYADSLLTQLSLSKGHRPILGARKERGLAPYDKILPIFPHVSCGIRARFTRPAVDYTSNLWMPESRERSRAVFSAASTPATQGFPWPKWFPSWCMDIQAASGP